VRCENNHCPDFHLARVFTLPIVALRDATASLQTVAKSSNHGAGL
jgi:hypothetical protein